MLQAEIEKAVSQPVKVQLLTGSTTARSSAVSCGCRPPLDSGGRSAIILIKFAPCLLTGVIAAAPFGRRPRVAAGWLDSGVCASRRRARLRYWSTPAMCWKIPPRGSPYKFVSLHRHEKGGEHLIVYRELSSLVRDLGIPAAIHWTAITSAGSSPSPPAVCGSCRSRTRC